VFSFRRNNRHIFTFTADAGVAILAYSCQKYSMMDAVKIIGVPRDRRGKGSSARIPDVEEVE